MDGWIGPAKRVCCVFKSRQRGQNKILLPLFSDLAVTV